MLFSKLLLLRLKMLKKNLLLKLLLFLQLKFKERAFLNFKGLWIIEYNIKK